MKNNQYCQWRRECQNYITKSAKQNILARLNKIECIVNQHGQIKNFKLPCDIKNKIVTDINNTILSWRGIEHESCKKIKKSLKEYKKTAVNWFNRNKSKIFGTYLFFPVIFGCVLQFCYQLQHLRDNTQKMIIFIEIFSSILKETIQFKKTKCQPIIPHQTLLVHNTFKSYCIQLVQHFDTIWDLADISPCKISNVYQKDKDRSKKTSDSFVKTLMNIHNKLQSVMDKDCYTLFSVQLNNVTQDNKSITQQDKATLEKYERIQMKQESDSVSSYNHLSDDVMLNNNTNNANNVLVQVKREQNIVSRQHSVAEIFHSKSNSNVATKQ
eukprot:358220_1